MLNYLVLLNGEGHYVEDVTTFAVRECWKRPVVPPPGCFFMLVTSGERDDLVDRRATMLANGVLRPRGPR